MGCFEVTANHPKIPFASPCAENLCHVKILIFLEPSVGVAHIPCKITRPVRSRVWEVNVIIAYTLW